MPRAVQVVLAVVAAVGLAAAGWVAAVLVARDDPSTAADGEVRRVGDRAVEFRAVVTAAEFEAAGEMAGYHLVVWRGGRAAGATLFRTGVTDVQVIRALEELGAEPGDSLSTDTWEERHDEDSEVADRVIEGPRVEIAILVPGRERPLRLGEILEDPGRRGFDMRFGGHEAAIPEWESGCVVCLYSCPGSKVGNAAYTVRDFVLGATRFRVRPGVLPRDGTEVSIRLELAQG